MDVEERGERYQPNTPARHTEIMAIVLKSAAFHVGVGGTSGSVSFAGSSSGVAGERWLLSGVTEECVLRR